MSKFIVYQGAEEKFRWRKVDDEGKFIEHSELLDSVELAINGATANDSNLQIENRVQEVQQ